MYKAGITMEATLRQRYNSPAAAGVSGYVARNLGMTLRGYFVSSHSEINPKNYTHSEALGYEKSAIITYQGVVGRKPPGNPRYT